jgi:hypothetical protein
MTSISDKMSTTWTFISELPSQDPLSLVLLIVAAACLHEWALIHYAAMAVTSFVFAWTGDVGGAMAGIFGSSGIDYTAYTYPVHTNRVFIQHGINLGIAGLFADIAIVALIFNMEAAPLIAFVPFLVDVGYFTAVDLPHLGSVIA